MNYRRIIGLALTAIGIYLIVFSYQSQLKITRAKGFLNDMDNFFNHNPTWNPIIKFFGGVAQGKVSQYDTQVLVCFIAGLVLVIVGILMTILCKNKKTS